MHIYTYVYVRIYDIYVGVCTHALHTLYMFVVLDILIIWEKLLDMWHTLKRLDKLDDAYPKWQTYKNYLKKLWNI